MRSSPFPSEVKVIPLNLRQMVQPREKLVLANPASSSAVGPWIDLLGAHLTGFRWIDGKSLAASARKPAAIRPACRDCPVYPVFHFDRVSQLCDSWQVRSAVPAAGLTGAPGRTVGCQVPIFLIDWPFSPSVQSGNSYAAGARWSISLTRFGYGGVLPLIS